MGNVGIKVKSKEQIDKCDNSDVVKQGSFATMFISNHFYININMEQIL